MVISPDDAFKYAAFYKEFLESGKATMEAAPEHDFSDLVCPLSKVRVVEVVETLREGDKARVVLGDLDSIKSVIQELRTRGIKPDFKQEGDSRFCLTIVR